MARRRPPAEVFIGWQRPDESASDPYFSGDPVPLGEPSPPALGEVIRGRIRQRLGGRIQELDVSVDDFSVVLRGRCATFYTKQLAQHVALGVLNDEHLDNRIEVTSS